MKNLSLKISFILLAFFSFTSQNLFSQDNDWNISLKQGLTYHINGKIYEKSMPINAKLFKYSLEAVHFDFGYSIANKHEIGFSINKNIYTIPGNFVRSIGFFGKDTTYNYSSGYGLRSFTSLGLFYAYKFSKVLKAGIRIGEVKPVIEGGENGFINLFIIRNFPFTKNLYISTEFNFSSRTRSFTNIRSQQVNLLIGINYGFNL